MDNKGKIIVVDCVSTSINYIADIVDAGYEPILLEHWLPEDQRELWRYLFDQEYSRSTFARPTVIMAKESYDDTLEMVKTINPIAIIPGNDMGLELATKLSNDLGLRSNDFSRLPYLSSKDMMHLALKEAGVRYIRGKVVSNVEEGLDYYRTKLSSRPAIVKPLHGAGAVGVYACMDECELVEAIEQNLKVARKDGEENSTVLIQEMIDGTEYYVNVVSMDGKHVITNIARYYKVQIVGKRPMYYRYVYLSSHDIEYAPLIEYTVKMLDAVGFTNGASHNEIMVDADGPVLIEINARVVGARQPIGFQDKVLGIHETEISLRSYLGQDITVSSKGIKATATSIEGVLAYPKIGNGMILSIVSVRDIDAVEAPLLDILSSMKSYHSHFGLTVPKYYCKTEDLSNVMGHVFMCHNDEEILERECGIIHDMEMNHPEKMFN